MVQPTRPTHIPHHKPIAFGARYAGALDRERGSRLGVSEKQAGVGDRVGAGRAGRKDRRRRRLVVNPDASIDLCPFP